MVSARTTGVAVETPLVMVTPDIEKWSPLDAARFRVEVKKRSEVDAPTVMTQGPPWSVVPAPGPELPAEAETVMPALKASRKASSTGSV